MLNEYKQESLRDLITRSRSSNNISQLIHKSLNDIKRELSQNTNDKNIKIHAILKLLFFYLQNHDIKWANLSTMEIITTGGLKGKRVGYLIAQLQFKNNFEWILMLPNLIRKDLQSQNNTVISMSLDLISNIMNLTLANEITKDLEKLLNLNNLLIRKKLVISLTKAAELMLKHKTNESFWDDLLIKLVAILSDKTNSTSKANSDKNGLTTGMQICIISCIQKICKYYPERVLTVFMELMNYFTKCEINWNIIKLIDIFGDFLKYENRLAKKKEFIKLISDKLAITKSKSVEIQLVKLVITNFDSVSPGNAIANELFNNCEERLKNLLIFNDNNLVLISLRILKELFKKNKVISNNYLADVTKILENSTCRPIQNECLDIVDLCVSKENFKNIVEKLLLVLPNLGSKATNTILNICIYDSYSRLEKKEDFIWFLNIIFELGKNEFLKNEGEVNKSAAGAVIGCFSSSGALNPNPLGLNNFSEQSEEIKIAYILRDIAQRIDSLRDFIINRSLDLAILLFSKIKNGGCCNNILGKSIFKARINSNNSSSGTNASLVSSPKKAGGSNLSKNIQKVFVEANDSSTNFFEENISLKNPNSLLTVLLFILSEYAFIELEKEKSSNDFFSRIFEFSLEFIDSMTASPYLKESYFYSFLIFLSKILTQAKANLKALKSLKISQNETKTFEQFQEILKTKLNALIAFEDLFDLESFGVLEMLKRLLISLNIEEEEFFAEFNSKKKLLPLHEKAQSMILLDKEYDINVCFPIDDDELNLNTCKNSITFCKSNPKANEPEHSNSLENNNLKSFANTIHNSSNSNNQQEKNIYNNSNNMNDERIIVDKKLYMPDSN